MIAVISARQLALDPMDLKSMKKRLRKVMLKEAEC